MLRHHALPVVQPVPRAAVPHLVRRPQHGAGISNRSATYSAAVHNRGVPKEPHVEEAVQRNPRTPEPAAHLPARLGRVLPRPWAAHLHYRHAIALLGQAQRSHAPAKPRPHHDVVEIEIAVLPSHISPRQTRMTNYRTVIAYGFLLIASCCCFFFPTAAASTSWGCGIPRRAYRITPVGPIRYTVRFTIPPSELYKAAIFWSASTNSGKGKW